MSTVSTDMVAVYDVARKRWVLYYINEGDIEFFLGPEDDQLEDLKTPAPYENLAIDFDKVKGKASRPKKGNTQLGVLEWKDGNDDSQTRIYYLDEDNNLVELGWSGAGPNWSSGSLTTSKFQADEHSIITTAKTKNQLKVYYVWSEKGKKPQLWVAFKALNQDVWSRRSVVDV